MCITISTCWCILELTKIQKTSAVKMILLIHLRNLTNILNKLKDFSKSMRSSSKVIINLNKSLN
jgi:hypothetical protein